MACENRLWYCTAVVHGEENNRERRGSEAYCCRSSCKEFSKPFISQNARSQAEPAQKLVVVVRQEGGEDGFDRCWDILY